MQEQDFENEDGTAFVKVFDNDGEICLDYYIDDEDGEISDDGDSVVITLEEFQALDFEHTYDNFVKYREEREARFR